MCVRENVPELGQAGAPAQPQSCTRTQGLHWQTEQAPEVRENQHPSLSVSSASAKQRGGKEGPNVLIVLTLQFRTYRSGLGEGISDDSNQTSS